MKISKEGEWITGELTPKEAHAILGMMLKGLRYKDGSLTVVDVSDMPENIFHGCYAAVHAIRTILDAYDQPLQDLAEKFGVEMFSYGAKLADEPIILPEHSDVRH